jgi:chromate transporter
VVAIVLHAAWRIGSRALKRPTLWAIAAAAFVAIFAFSVPFPAIVLAAGVIGYVGGRVAPREFAVGGGHDAQAGAHLPAVLDDDTPTPTHALFRASRLALVVAIALALWLFTLAMLVASYGPGAPLPRMGWFFTKAALLTFGGAYAVLPYVYQGAVGHYGWLTPTQMIDGLALGETTPGPLIMVVAFVGFIGGWTKALFGPESLTLAGIAGACVATFFTFLPSFLFILAGGPLVETTHGQLKFTAPLSGITAAVVGVIVNLALFFAWHVFWPRGGRRFSARRARRDRAGVGIAAAAALFRFKTGVSGDPRLRPRTRRAHGDAGDGISRDSASAMSSLKHLLERNRAWATRLRVRHRFLRQLASGARLPVDRLLGQPRAREPDRGPRPGRAVRAPQRRQRRGAHRLNCLSVLQRGRAA